MSSFSAQLHRPKRPRRGWRTLVRRFRHDLELMHGKRLLPMAGSQTIGAGVATANDHDMLASRENLYFGLNRVAVTPLVLLRQEFHRVMNSLQLTTGNLQITRMLRPTCQHDRIKLAAKLIDRN